MWENCIESVGKVKSGVDGYGCILAHSMGLGKTLQVCLQFSISIIYHPLYEENGDDVLILLVLTYYTSSYLLNIVSHQVMRLLSDCCYFVLNLRCMDSI